MRVELILAIVGQYIVFCMCYTHIDNFGPLYQVGRNREIAIRKGGGFVLFTCTLLLHRL